MNSDIERMMQMITGYWVTQIVNAAATYSFADHLAKGPATAEVIARSEGIDRSAAFRLLRACASLGIVTYDSKSRFAATPLLETLRADNPKTLRGLALALPAPGHWLPWGRLTESIKTGESQTIPTLGTGLFEYFAMNPAEAGAFTEAMTSLTLTIAEETSRVIDTSAVSLAADIGGAGGTLLYSLLRVHSHLRGIVFDRPNVIAGAHAAAVAAGLSERVTTVAGDFFQSVPEADLYLLKHILHDWDDESCIRILRNCRRALRPGGRVAVIEFLLSEIGEPSLAPLFDMNMMVVANGRERSLTEYQQLFEAAQLRVRNVIPTGPSMVIVEAVAA